MKSVGAVEPGVTTRATVGKFAGGARKSHLDCCFVTSSVEKMMSLLLLLPCLGVESFRMSSSCGVFV